MHATRSWDAHEQSEGPSPLKMLRGYLLRLRHAGPLPARLDPYRRGCAPGGWRAECGGRPVADSPAALGPCVARCTARCVLSARGLVLPGEWGSCFQLATLLPACTYALVLFTHATPQGLPTCCWRGCSATTSPARSTSFRPLLPLATLAPPPPLPSVILLSLLSSTTCTGCYFECCLPCSGAIVRSCGSPAWLASHLLLTQRSSLSSQLVAAASSASAELADHVRRECVCWCTSTAWHGSLTSARPAAPAAFCPHPMFLEPLLFQPAIHQAGPSFPSPPISIHYTRPSIPCCDHQDAGVVPHIPMRPAPPASTCRCSPWVRGRGAGAVSVAPACTADGWEKPVAAVAAADRWQGGMEGSRKRACRGGQAASAAAVRAGEQWYVVERLCRVGPSEAGEEMGSSRWQAGSMGEGRFACAMPRPGRAALLRVSSSWQQNEEFDAVVRGRFGIRLGADDVRAMPPVPGSRHLATCWLASEW
ncbi:unnamed protein product [Closterium sp. NIES-64]|nr:unnamed protein product [Closterium sp. NIES-64]